MQISTQSYKKHFVASYNTVWRKLNCMDKPSELEISKVWCLDVKVFFCLLMISLQELVKKIKLGS